jgi:hypothetical protein
MKVTVYLEPSEVEALGRLGLAELRSGSSQASWIVKQELRRLGLVTGPDVSQQSQGQLASDHVGAADNDQQQQ